MPNVFRGPLIALTSVLVFSTALFAQTPTPSGAPKSFDLHDLSGLWNRPTGTGTMAEDGKKTAGTGAIFTPEGKAALETHKPSMGPRQVLPALGNDPMGTCDPLGIPRDLFLDVRERALEFVQLPDRMLQFFEWQHQFRTIWMDGRQLPKDPDPRWNGYAVGRWEGDTFVVDSVGFDERSWLDMLGDPHSDALRVQERYRRLDHDRLEQTLTFTDPKFLLEPWTGTAILHLTPGEGIDDLPEAFCVPTEEAAFNKRIRDRAVGIK